MLMNFDKIAELRAKRQLTMEEAAIRAGYQGTRPRAWWNDIESGKVFDPRISTLVKVCRALQCRVEDLLILNEATAAAMRRTRIQNRS